VLSVEDLLLHILHVLIHDVDPASIFLQFKVHLLQLLLQVLHNKREAVLMRGLACLLSA
jgi:hypothetical protein